MCACMRVYVHACVRACMPVSMKCDEHELRWTRQLHVVYKYNTTTQRRSNRKRPVAKACDAFVFIPHRPIHARCRLVCSCPDAHTQLSAACGQDWLHAIPADAASKAKPSVGVYTGRSWKMRSLSENHPHPPPRLCLPPFPHFHEQGKVQSRSCVLQAWYPATETDCC